MSVRFSPSPQDSSSIEQIRSCLAESGLVATNQRVEIAQYLLCEADHPTAAEVLVAVRGRLPSVSQATVYNTLRALVTSGIAKEVRSAKGALRYDGNVGAHHHLLDTHTGQLIDIPLDEIQIANLDELEKKYNVNRVCVVLEGSVRSHSTSRSTQDNINPTSNGE
tara:strand:+ start:218 stop:712 length:495 start_codon:yes stop_codon:yes gene_type:complete